MGGLPAMTSFCLDSPLRCRHTCLYTCTLVDLLRDGFWTGWFAIASCFTVRRGGLTSFKSVWAGFLAGISHRSLTGTRWYVSHSLSLSYNIPHSPFSENFTVSGNTQDYTCDMTTNHHSALRLCKHRSTRHADKY